MDCAKLIKGYRRKAIAQKGEFPFQVDYGRAEIEKLIPHRPPFLLLDRIEALDLTKRRIFGSRFLRAEEPVFKGHFPGHPVYPGALQLEMAGQLGLCLYRFISQNTHLVSEVSGGSSVRVTQVIGAYFDGPLLPETTAFCIAQLLEWDDYTGTVLLQTLNEGGVCSVAAVKVVFL